MKVKISDFIIDADKQPVMLILSEQDKKNIAKMHPGSTKYACFPKGWGTEKEMDKWMDEDQL